MATRHSSEAGEARPTRSTALCSTRVPGRFQCRAGHRRRRRSRCRRAAPPPASGRRPCCVRAEGRSGGRRESRTVRRHDVRGGAACCMDRQAALELRQGTSPEAGAADALGALAAQVGHRLRGETAGGMQDIRAAGRKGSQARAPTVQGHGQGRRPSRRPRRQSAFFWPACLLQLVDRGHPVEFTEEVARFLLVNSNLALVQVGDEAAAGRDGWLVGRSVAVLCRHLVDTPCPTQASGVLGALHSCNHSQHCGSRRLSALPARPRVCRSPPVALLAEAQRVVDDDGHHAPPLLQM